MPRVRRKMLGRRGYSRGHIYELAHGLSPPPRASTSLVFTRDSFCGDEKAAAAAWPELREAVFAEVDRYNKWRGYVPFENPHAILRPWGWYLCEGPDGRLDDGADGYEYGRVLDTKPEPTGEFEYLLDHGFLTPAEEKRGLKHLKLHSFFWERDDA